MPVKFVNATPQPLRLYQGDTYVEFPPLGPPARVRRTPVEIGVLWAVTQDGSQDVVLAARLFAANVSGLRGLPAPEPDTLVIVSAEVAREGRHFRDDLVAPYIFVREDGETGAVVGFEAFVAYNSDTLEKVKDAIEFFDSATGSIAEGDDLGQVDA